MCVCVCWCPALPWSRTLLTDSDSRWPGCHGPAVGAGGSDGGGNAPGSGFPCGQVHGGGKPRASTPAPGWEQQGAAWAGSKQAEECLRVAEDLGKKIFRILGFCSSVLPGTGTEALWGAARGGGSLLQHPRSYTPRKFYSCAMLYKVLRTSQLCPTRSAASDKSLMQL